MLAYSLLSVSRASHTFKKYLKINDEILLRVQDPRLASWLFILVRTKFVVSFLAGKYTVTANHRIKENFTSKLTDLKLSPINEKTFIIC